MRQQIGEFHEVDENNNPAGGTTTATGIEINWQDGPLGSGPDRKEPNGAFVEGVIQAAIGRLEFYQESKFRCEANDEAIEHLEQALRVLDRRTAERESRGVEGTHSP